MKPPRAGYGTGPDDHVEVLVRKPGDPRPETAIERLRRAVAEDEAKEAEGSEPMSEPTPKCPACGSDRVIPIGYGEPTPEGEAAARRGEVVLGGCIIGADSPAWACRACGEEFGTLGKERDDG